MSICRHMKDVSCSWLFASFSQPLQAELTLLSQSAILSWFKERISDDMNLSVHRRLVFAMSNILSSECAMRGRKIESEHGLREQPRRRLSSPGSSPCGYTFSRSPRAQQKMESRWDGLGINLPVHLYWRFQYVQYGTVCWFDYCTVRPPLQTENKWLEKLITELSWLFYLVIGYRWLRDLVVSVGYIVPG